MTANFDELERAACIPHPIHPEGFNPSAVLPHGLATGHIRTAMEEFQDVLGFINTQLNSRQLPRFERMIMQASFSGFVGEFAVTAIPKYCPTLAKNRFHNGHPDMVPAGAFPGDSVRHAPGVGIEVKGSRYLKSWQGHNAERSWLMVFVFESGRPTDESKGVTPMPFRYLTVLGAQLETEDWLFAGRSATSRRTITASVTATGYEKMVANWIYRDPCRVPTVDMLLDVPSEGEAAD